MTLSPSRGGLCFTPACVTSKGRQLQPCGTDTVEGVSAEILTFAQVTKAKPPVMRNIMDSMVAPPASPAVVFSSPEVASLRCPLAGVLTSIPFFGVTFSLLFFYKDASPSTVLGLPLP